MGAPLSPLWPGGPERETGEQGEGERVGGGGGGRGQSGFLFDL